LRYESGSTFNGTLRYLGSACTPDGRIILCGGCLVSTGDATNTCYEALVAKPNKFTRKKIMGHRRYAHACAFLNGYIYALGGFDNKDADGVAPSTLDSCERYSIHENKWTTNCAMNEGRAFAGVCAIGE
jgi:N-acetylneuraminic acid mutarotase